MDTLKVVQNTYEAWIVEHPEAIGDLQKTAKLLDFVLSARGSTAHKLSKIIYHLMKNYNVQIPRRPQDSQDNLVDLLQPPSKDMKTYTLENIKKFCEAWIAENPEAIEDLKNIVILLVSFIAGAASSKVVLSRIIFQLMLDYNDRIIKRSRDANTSDTTLQSKL